MKSRFLPPIIKNSNEFSKSFSNKYITKDSNCPLSPSLSFKSFDDDKSKQNLQITAPNVNKHDNTASKVKSSMSGFSDDLFSIKTNSERQEKKLIDQDIKLEPKIPSRNFKIMEGYNNKAIKYKLNNKFKFLEGNLNTEVKIGKVICDIKYNIHKITLQKKQINQKKSTHNDLYQNRVNSGIFELENIHQANNTIDTIDTMTIAKAEDSKSKQKRKNDQEQLKYDTTTLGKKRAQLLRMRNFLSSQVKVDFDHMEIEDQLYFNDLNDFN